MAQQQLKSAHKLDKVDPVWTRIREEAEEVARREPELSSFIYSSILHHDAFEQAGVHRIAERLAQADASGELIRQAYADALEDDPSIGDAFRADIVATIDRDPAAHRYIDPLLYFKGFHAIQTHRLAHWLWKKGRKDFALYLQSRSSAVFATDINPNARIGRGIFLDHATGLVVGETAAIDDDVSILHGVTLGGTGKENEDRHPKIRRGVMLGAGAKILGNIEVGHCSRVAAGSVVLKPVPPNTTVAGVPAKESERPGAPSPHAPWTRCSTIWGRKVLPSSLPGLTRQSIWLKQSSGISMERGSRPRMTHWALSPVRRAPWTSPRSRSSTAISSACSVAHASAWCRGRRTTSTPKCCLGRSRSGASWSTTKTTSARTISRSRLSFLMPGSPSSITSRWRSSTSI